MAKIHKSSAVILDTNKPVIIDRPELGFELRERMMAGADKLNPGLTVRKRQELEAEQRRNVMLQEADNMIARAQAQADDIIQKAQQESFDIARQAYSEASEKARQEAKAEYEAKITALDTQLNQIAAALQEEKNQVLAQVEPEILKLSLTIAEKIIGSELEEHAETYASMMQQIVEKLRPDEKVTIYVNEKDYWHSLAGQNNKTDQDWSHIKIVRDENLARGGCKVEGSFGQLDAGIKKQLNTIRRQWQLDE